MSSKTKTIAILNQKGGVGKTTTAVNLAVGLAAGEPAMQVLLVDLDPLGHAGLALGVPRYPAIYKVLIEEVPLENVAPWAWGKPGDPGVVRVLTSNNLTGRITDALPERPFREGILKEKLGEATWADFIILDLPPGVGFLQWMALVAADHVLIVTKLDHLAIVGVDDSLKTMRELGKHGIMMPQLLGILPTFWERVTNESHKNLKELLETFGGGFGGVLEPIPVDVKVREASAQGESLWKYAPTCRAILGLEYHHGRLKRPVGGYRQAVRAIVKFLG